MNAENTTPSIRTVMIDRNDDTARLRPGLTIRTGVQAGGFTLNHSGLAVHTDVRAGIITYNHNAVCCHLG